LIAIKNLNGIKSGVYRVSTEKSIYLFDFENMQAMRTTASNEALRKDGEWFKFITVACDIGKPMAIWTNNIAGGGETFTYRYSTEVKLIEKVDRYER
jgi:hypothetical protein